MSYVIKKNGMIATISKFVPEAAIKAIIPMFRHLRAAFDITHKAASLVRSQASSFDWAIHPGGASILQGAKQALCLTDDHIRASLDVYQHHGNSSSPTVLIVLDKLRMMGEGRENDDRNGSCQKLSRIVRKTKKKRMPSRYADPSKYAHLSPLVDILQPNLICVFVGTNPGVQTAAAGHAYAHPSNLFWKLLHSSGLTDRRLKPEEDRSLPDLYCMGNTNIVERPSKDAAELSKEETAAGTAKLDAKFLKYKPEAVCIVGKGIWEAIWRYRYGKNLGKKDFKYGWQDEEHNMGKSRDDKEERDTNGNVWKGSRVFVTTSTSGLAASLKPAEKEAIWKPFGEWVQKRRAERNFAPRPLEAQEASDETLEP
ncbi:unnamed protein product [Alternaria alternata]